MSKGNMLLGQARGKVGSLVFARQDGQQIVRSRAEVVRNPQTEAQMIQRILLNTVAQAYSNMSELCDHSFEGFAPGQKSMSFFMQKNLNALRQRIAQEVANGSFLSEIYEFSPIGSSILVSNAYLISKGTLPTVGVTSVDTDWEMGLTLSANTYQAILQDYGLQRGDQLTFVALTANGSDDCTMSFCRVILNPTASDGSDALLSAPLVVDGKVNYPSPRNEGSFTSLRYEDGKLVFGFGKSYMLSSAIIVSRQRSDGTWMRSTASLIRNDAGATLTYDMQTCLDMLKGGGIGTLSERYLNNAGTSHIADNGGSLLSFEVAAKVCDSSGQEATSRGSVTGAGSYVEGSTCRLQATANSGYQFVGWYEGGQRVSTANPYSFEVHGAHTFQARFEDAMP